MGVATGLKLTNATFALGLLAIIVFSKDSTKTKLKDFFVGILSLMIGYSISGGYWSIYLWEKFKNPIFPYFNKLFKSPYVTTTSNFHDPRWFPHNILQAIFYPLYFTFKPLLVVEVKFFDLRILLLYIFILLVVFLEIGYLIYKKRFKPFKTILSPQIYIFTIVSYVLWEIEFSYLRYAIVLEYLSIMIIFIAIFEIIKNDGLKEALLTGICLLILLTTHFANWGRINWQASYFNVSLPKKVNLTNSIIVTNNKPVGYLVPFFPNDDQFIRIGGSFKTPIDQKIVSKYIKQGENLNKPFYVLVLTDINMMPFVNSLSVYNLKLNQCYDLKSNVNILYQDKTFTSLCSLTYKHNR